MKTYILMNSAAQNCNRGYIFLYDVFKTSKQHKTFGGVLPLTARGVAVLAYMVFKHFQENTDSTTFLVARSRCPVSFFNFAIGF